MERVMGRVDTPVRQLVDDAFERFVRPRCDIRFLLTVVEDTSDGSLLRGIYAGDQRDVFVAAAELSRTVNVTVVDRPIDRCVVCLDRDEFGSTWVGNKAIYRTRMALAGRGELFVIAPGIRTFGEDATIDALIRRHGYHGTPDVLAAVRQDQALRDNLAAAAHLIHGSTEGRFDVTYCTSEQMPAEALLRAGYRHCPLSQALGQFDIGTRADGWHQDREGRPYYLIRNPGLGLWTTSERLTSSR
jgi:hypothetical protein